MGARDDLLESGNLPAVRGDFLPLGVNLRHLGAVVDAVDRDAAPVKQSEKLADERAGVNQQAADADTALSGADASGDLGIDLEAAAGRKHDARRCGLFAKSQRDWFGVDLPGVFEILLFPELLEILCIIGGKWRGIDFDDVVLHQRKGVVGHVSRAGPDGLAIAHNEFAVHQFHPGDATPGIT